MSKVCTIAAAIAMLAAGTWSHSVQADSAQATCEVRKDGDMKKGASGPCTISQRQGYIDIDLKNGDNYSLSPGGKANHYKDQKGIKVVRTQSGGNTEEFKWEGGKKIIVTLATSPAVARPAQASYVSGETVPDLADLVGARAGQAEGALQSRGYVYTKGSTSGNAKYSAWYNASTGRCAMIQTADGRYQSIVQAPPADCGR